MRRAGPRIASKWTTIRELEPESRGLQEWLSAENCYEALEILVNMRRIRRFDWICGSRPRTLILHGEAITLTKTEAWVRILTVFKEKFRPSSWTRLIETATPLAGVLERKGVKPHAESEGVYSND